MGQIAASTFYSIGDTVTPTRMSMLTYTLYIPGKVLSFYFWGVAGLAVTTSIYYLLNLSLQIYLLNEKSVL
jgi:peptidoglycan biosynthesis protein MviN/MurJ (putative lipid II flippase)